MVRQNYGRFSTVRVRAFQYYVVSFANYDKSEDSEGLDNIRLRSINRKFHFQIEASAIYASRAGLPSSRCSKNLFFP